MFGWRGRSRRNLGALSQPVYLRSPIDRAHRRKLTTQKVVRIGKAVLHAEPLTEYADDPIGFCRDVLGVEVWSVRDYETDNPEAGGQVEIMESVRDNPRTAVAACYASGKTFTAACLSIWWLMTRRPAMLMTTAPTHRQVKSLLWREIRKLIKRARRQLPGRPLQTQWFLADDWWGMGFASDDPNRVAGLHETANVLFIEDEAAGMEQEVVEGFEGITAAEGSRHLKIGNPICQSGPFFDSHKHPEESKRWKKISIDAEDTPNVRERRAVVPGLVSHDWVDDKRHKWLKRGLLHLWETRVKGRFHITSGDKCVPLEWIQLAHGRWGEVSSEGVRALGVDVAGGGRDGSSAYLQTGRVVTHQDDWDNGDLMWQAEHVAAMAERLQVQVVYIDKTGQGKGVYDRLMQLQREEGRLHGIKIVGVGMGESPEERDVYHRKSDEVQFNLRWALNPENPNAIALDPEDKQLAEELGWREWWTNDGHLIQTTPKKKLKALFGGSPDHADAVGVLFAEPTKEEGWFFIG